MFSYKGKAGDLHKVFDSRDGVTEEVNDEALRRALLQVEISGIYFDEDGNIMNEFGDVVVASTVKSKSKNNNLTQAKKAKNDEFYTQLEDIEKELSHYPPETFKDKVIYCPTDVAVNTGAILQSQFVKYFQMNAHRLQFKKLIATCLVEKAQGDGQDVETVQNCYVLERVKVPVMQRNIYGYTHGSRDTDTVVDEVYDFGIKYQRKNGGLHAVPYHIVNQAVTDANGRIEIVGKYVDGFDQVTGKPNLVDEFKGNYWYFEGHKLAIKWCLKHPDGRIELLPEECYFFNNDNVISDLSIFPEGVINDSVVPCYEKVEGGSVCLYPAEYYDYKEVDYTDVFVNYSFHCPEDSGKFGGSGDFRSEYCTKLLQEADIVVTNPPFSLFREFVGLLVDYDKKFIILGNSNAVCTKEIFPLLKNNKIWWGNTMNGGGQHWFLLPDGTDYNTGKIELRADDKGIEHRYAMIGTVAWWTNCDFNKRHERIIGLTKSDNESSGVSYPKYDNYDAINITRCNKIPVDYDGLMGVPVTYIGIHNPEQFEILGLTNSSPDLCYCKISEESDTRAKIDGKAIYARVLIRHCKDENGKLV